MMMQYTDEDPDIYNGHYAVGALINCRPRTVWDIFIDSRNWVDSHKIEPLCGAPDVIGSINRVSFKRTSDFSMPPAHHHYCKLIEFSPERRHILKTYSEKGGSYGWDIVAFDDTKFSEIGDQTQVIFDLFIEIKADVVATDRASVDAAMSASREGMLRNLEKLKAIAEAAEPEAYDG